MKNTKDFLIIILLIFLISSSALFICKMDLDVKIKRQQLEINSMELKNKRSEYYLKHRVTNKLFEKRYMEECYKDVLDLQ